jgi:tetratricopeptide (TPR) repeat protein
MPPRLCYTEGVRLKLNSLETKLFSAAQPDQAWGALIASGVVNSVDLDNYLAKLNTLHQQVAAEIPAGSELTKAGALFDWLWHKKPNRSERKGSYKVTEVLDAQLDPKIEKVGNCLGLTVLYHVLAQRLGLKVKAVHVEDAFGQGPHVFSILYTGQCTVDIEHILPNGFDFKGHLHNPHRIKWGDAELIADIYHSIGNKFFEQGSYEEAVQSYSKAIRLNPKYTKAYLNRGISLSMLGREEEARRDLEQQE